MSAHEYSAQEALELLIRKLQQRDETLAGQVQAAIDVGKDISEAEPSLDRRKKPRIYRRTVPFEVEEALQVAVNALQSYFVEQPLFVNSAADNLAKIAIGIPVPGWSASLNDGDEREEIHLEQEQKDKEIEIELHTETQIRKTGEELLSLRRTPLTEVAQQQESIRHLRTLMNFSAE